jgi:hypothetical protein
MSKQRQVAPPTGPNPIRFDINQAS